MNNFVTVNGIIATSPRYIVTAEGTPFTSFRLAVSSDDGGDSNWYTFLAKGKLATNVANSVAKHDRIIVTGALVVRDWENDDRAGTYVEIVAEYVGHDLNWGTSKFVRNRLSLDKS